MKTENNLSFFSMTSPVWKQEYQGDDLIFQIIGKYWAKGFLPYVDIWDHKGPLLFLLNAIGYFLTGGKEGVFLVQILFLTVSIPFVTFFQLALFGKKIISLYDNDVYFYDSDLSVQQYRRVLPSVFALLFSAVLSVAGKRGER